jgi:exodeoxyribonuclease V alpha subunit
MTGNDNERGTVLEGQIERVVFTSEDTGYTVVQFKIDGRPEPVTVVGSLHSPTPGEMLRLQGQWTTHPRYGRQFKADRHETQVPATAEGIRRYLGSGMVRGIGPEMARRIVETFGEQTLEVIDGNADALNRVEGIGPKRVDMIRDAWNRQKEIRNVMVFLQGHGVGSGYAAKIFKRYGQRAIAVVRANPYRLAAEVSGIGFSTADKIASQIGIDQDAPMRIEAGVLHGLWTLAAEGHAYYPFAPLMEFCAEMLAVSRETVAGAATRLANAGRVVVENLRSEGPDATDSGRAVYLPPLHRNEKTVAERLQRLMNCPKGLSVARRQQTVRRARSDFTVRLAKDQQTAVDRSLTDKVLIITGGPGTGKTTIISAIVHLFSRLTSKILLAAPTGRAAKRMSEATGSGAMTIHRMLDFSIQKGGFQRNEEKPLSCELLVVDEASMIDTTLMAHLLRAVPDPATVIFVGDVQQLPSVGPGNVLSDMIASGRLPVVELTEIFRQARASRIIVNAHRIHQGQMPGLNNPAPGVPKTDFYFFEQEDPERVLDRIRTLAAERIPQGFGFDPVEDIQVLTPMHKGIVGAANLNRILQDALNPAGEGIVRGEKRFRVGDKVMQIRNNYPREVFNGDIGWIEAIDPAAQEVTVRFDARRVLYEFADLDELVLAYAVSVHKSQGSEFKAVVMPVVTQHFILLQRNLLYTAVTRARELMVIVGTRKALSIAIGNDAPQKRYTHLKWRIRQSLPE